MSGVLVDYVTSYLYLGVDIDNMLTFKKYHNMDLLEPICCGKFEII